MPITTCSHGINVTMKHLCVGCKRDAEAAEARRKQDAEALQAHREKTPSLNKTHLDKLFDVMADSAWRTLEEIKSLIPDSQATGISAALRQLRHAQFGGFVVEKQVRDGNVWEYRVLAPTGKEQARQTKDVQIANLKARVSELEEEVRDAEAAKLALEAELASYRLAAVSVPVTVDAEAKAS